MTFRTTLVVAACAAVWVYVALQPHEHPCPPCDHSVYMERIAELERQVAARTDQQRGAEIASGAQADASKRLEACEYKRWLQNGDHGQVK
jgi:hypothetical protein